MKKWIIIIVGMCVLSGLFLLPFAIPKQHKPSVTTSKAQTCEVEIHVEGQNKVIPLEEYLVGVVAAEMPISFHKEALKAQAIAARTYVLKSTEGGKRPISPTVLRQVFIDEKERKEKWGNYFSGNESKLREIITETKGQVLLHQGELITAMFHSMSNGRTESAVGFSGNYVPYLKSVASDWEKQLPNFTQSKNFTLQQWQNIFGATNFNQLSLQRNDSGRVAQMIVGEGVWEGREVREMLDLRSTDFDVTYDGSEKLVTVTTRGYGHGVGMSQYGANMLAKDGKKADEILSYYYQSVEISRWNQCLK